MSVIIGTIHFVEKKNEMLMKCFFIQKTSPSLGTFSCEQTNVV